MIFAGSNLWGSSSPVPLVSEGNVLGLPAAWRAINLCANGVAQMTPPRVLAADGVTPLDAPPIVTRPCAAMGAFDFWHSAVAHLNSTGNLVGILADPEPATGWPRQAIPVNSSFVHCYFDAAGFVRYTIGDLDLSAEEVVHVRLYTIPGDPWGIGAVTNFRRALGAKLDEQNLSAGTFKQGAVPSGIVKVHRPKVTKDQADEIQEQWITAHSSGGRVPAVLSEQFDFTPIAWSPEDAEFLASRQFSVAEIAFMFNLDPTDLAAAMGMSGALTYANTTQREVSRTVNTYGPICRRFGDAWSDLLPGGSFVQFVPEHLMLMTPLERAELQAVELTSGTLTKNEARAALNREPIAEPTPAPAPVPEVTTP